MDKQMTMRQFGLLGYAISLLSVGSALADTNALIALGSTWKYLDDGSDQGTAWRAPTFEGSSPVSNYRVYREGTLLTELPAVLGYTDTEVTAGVAYHYQVSAVNAVGEIVGQTTTEDLLDSIFSRFCIGK